MARTSKNTARADAESIWKTALYIRLSREDGDKEESDSIGNQRQMLMSYVSENPEFKLYDIYVDDGFTGTNFNRPDFKRMIADMEQKNINCIIVKDLSRFGRDYIGVGNYQENIFPRYDIRFIALNDRIDTYLCKDDSQSILVPFTNIINEQYARDISRKVRSALDTKRKSGEFIGAFASYGYCKDPDDHNKLVIDPEAAENVRNIFHWFIGGMPKLSIAYKLNELGIACPSEYKKQKGMKYVNSNCLKSTNYWTHTSIHRILKNEIYIGNMVQHTQSKKSFKIKQNVRLDKSDWIIVKGTHEPIIDTQTWEIAQRLLNTDIKKSQYTGKIHLFAGLIKCGDCGRAMKKRVNHGGKYEYYICGTYQAYGKAHCTSHSIRTDELTEMVLGEIKAQIAKYVDYEKLQNELHARQSVQEAQRENEQALAELTKKLEKVTKLKQGLYEDLKSGVLSKDEYFCFKNQYEKDMERFRHSIALFSGRMNDINTNGELRKSAELVLKYKDIQVLTREMLVSLVKSVTIYSDKTITIHFNFKPI